MTQRQEIWMALKSFGDDAVASVVGDRARDLHAAVTDDELMAMARASTTPYWSDGTTLWSSYYALRNAQPISAADALARFGLDVLEDAQEKGSSSR